MSQTDNNRRYEARQRAKGYVRGPRIRGEAAERLRELAYCHNLSPCEVVSRLLLDEPLGANIARRHANPHGFSDIEMRDATEMGIVQ